MPSRRVIPILPCSAAAVDLARPSDVPHACGARPRAAAYPLGVRKERAVQEGVIAAAGVGRRRGGPPAEKSSEGILPSEASRRPLPVVH